ncbi:MAG TPA: Wadjet anti-phage system protein JetD domain-containing protein [Candidatus Angelobacter sp.]|nr:Wadjet anti-phage system protein JetD domain-containing protein [Candidatus Angelobacter sp.]
MIAERDLADAASAGLLTLVHHNRDPRLIQQIRFSRAQEEAFFAHIGEPSPTAKREELAEIFRRASQVEVGPEWRTGWRSFCENLQVAALSGDSVQPFSRNDLGLNNELLTLIPKILAWRGESLIRFASCVLCGNSKRLQSLEGRLGQILGTITQGEKLSLEDIGIVANPHFALLHGPIRLLLGKEWVDFGQLSGPFRISEADIRNAERIAIDAQRCLTVENETTFHELAKLRSGELLIQTSFASSATLALLDRLPRDLQCWHFGDSDPEGFDILRDLRERTGRPFQSFQMCFRQSEAAPALTGEQRTKLQRLISSPSLVAEREQMERILWASSIGLFEQEQLGKPRFPHWPFY